MPQVIGLLTLYVIDHMPEAPQRPMRRFAPDSVPMRRLAVAKVQIGVALLPFHPRAPEGRLPEDSKVPAWSLSDVERHLLVSEKKSINLDAQAWQNVWSTEVPGPMLE
jgi:hypothetical protein